MVTFNPAGGSLDYLSADASICPTHPHTFGEIPWNRGKLIRNETPYSLQFKYLNVLIKEKNTKEPIFYSWDLRETKVSPQAAVQIKAASIPSWIDGRAMRKWIEYDVIERTDEQNKTVINMMTGGVFSLALEKITIHSINALSGTDAYRMIFKVRSKYFEPKSKKFIEKQVIFDEDKVDKIIPDIYKANWDQRSTESDPLFEYKLEIIMQDGKTHSSNKWVPHNSLTCYIGTSQIEQSLGFLPGTDGGT
jgi:hypothetical protein